MNTITMSGIIVTLFLGGPQPIKIGDTTLDIPLIGNAWEGTVWFLLKVLVFLYMYVWFRATLPRLRYDQLMDFGWKVLIPIALGWFVVLAAITRRPRSRLEPVDGRADRADRDGPSATCCSVPR